MIPSFFLSLIQPTRLFRWMAVGAPWVSLIGLTSGVWGMYEALFASPADYQQGEMVRLLYVHVPLSWAALATYTLMAGASGLAFILRSPFLHLCPYALAPLGATYAFLSLITGAIWGKPTWGTWWVWDARLTSMLVLFFLYLGYMVLVSHHPSRTKGLKAGSVLALIGWINIPIIKGSVTWWHSLHQPASIRLFAKSAIHPSMLLPLLLMGLALGCFTFLLFRWRLMGHYTAQSVSNRPLALPSRKAA